MSSTATVTTTSTKNMVSMHRGYPQEQQQNGAYCVTTFHRKKGHQTNESNYSPINQKKKRVKERQAFSCTIPQYDTLRRRQGFNRTWVVRRRRDGRFRSLMRQTHINMRKDVWSILMKRWTMHLDNAGPHRTKASRTMAQHSKRSPANERLYHCPYPHGRNPKPNRLRTYDRPSDY